MLPGLQIFDVQELMQCEVVNSIALDFESNKTKEACEYQSSQCTAECNEHHLIVYLENILHRGFPVDHEEIKEMLRHGNAKVRKIALMLHYKHFPGVEVPTSLQRDPHHAIREMYLMQGEGLGIHSMVKQTQDENPRVRAAAIWQLTRFAGDERYRMKILRPVCRAMRDRELSIRILASRALGEFAGIPDEVVQKLLSKQVAGSEDPEICGALVYGIEDEYSDVRRNTVASVYQLTSAGTASKVFDFAADSLNDEDHRLRETCTFYLKELSTKYVLAVDSEIVRQICESLKERCGKVRANILELLGNLRYEDTDVFDILASHIGADNNPQDMLRCLGKVTANNRKTFLAGIDKFYKRTAIAQIESSLDDKLYIARLMVHRELKRANPEVQTDKTVEDHFLFLSIMECKEPDVSGDGHVFFRDILCQFLEEGCSEGRGKVGNYRRLFRQMRKENDHRYWFIYCLYAGMKEMGKKRERILKRIPLLFTNTGFEVSVADDIKGMVRYIRNVDFKSIRPLRYVLDAPSKVEVYKGMPIRLSINLLLEGDGQDVHLKTWSPNKPPIYFKAKETVDICILDDVSLIYCSIVKLFDEEDIRLSSIKAISVNRKKPKRDLIPGIGFW